MAYPPTKSKRMGFKLIDSAAKKYPAKDEKTTLKASLVFVNWKKSLRVSFKPEYILLDGVNCFTKIIHVT